MNQPDSLRHFILNLIVEYEKRRNEIIDQMKIYLNKLSEKEALIHSLSQTRKKSSNLFSPNSKDYNIEQYFDEKEDIKNKINQTEEEKSKLDNIIKQLKEIYGIIQDPDSPNFNLGLNILSIQEQDRKRIARDLHDSTVQNLTGLIHKCELCSRLVDMDTVRTKLELSTMSNTLKSVISEIREIIYNLKPMSLDDLGLLTTVERFVNQLMMSHDIKINVTHNDEIEDILPVIKISIFRIIQEACINAIKHADAKSIDINITYNEQNIEVSIADDGKGFDAENRKDQVAPDYSGYGLSIMKERVYLLSGTMKIKSATNKGTIVTITVPITKSGGN